MSYGFLAPLLVLAMAVAPAAADDKQDAAALAAQSAKHYKRGEFEQAAALLREAHAKYPEPNLLYNLARALEGLGDQQGAIDAYEAYLASGKRIEDRGGIERRVATLKAELAEQARREEQARAEPPKQVEPKPPPVVVLEAPPPPPREGKKERSRTLPWITIASGAAIAIAGGVMAYRANSNDEKSRDAMSGVDAQTFHDRARRDALAANILFGVGGAVMITGVVLVW